MKTTTATTGEEIEVRKKSRLGAVKKLRLNYKLILVIALGLCGLRAVPEGAWTFLGNLTERSSSEVPAAPVVYREAKYESRSGADAEQKPEPKKKRRMQPEEKPAPAPKKAARDEAKAKQEAKSSKAKKDDKAKPE
jgi:hypothetical protein